MAQKQAQMAQPTSLSSELDGDSDTQAPGTSFARFLRDVIIGLLILGGGMFAYYRNVTQKEQIAKLTQEAVTQLRRDNLAALQSAEKAYLSALEIRDDDGGVLSGLAEVYFRQAFHGLPTQSKSKEFLARAEASGTESAARYAVSAYHQILEGQADQAVTALRKLLDQGLAAPKLAHAYGWALMASGRTQEANRVLTQARDADFSAVAFRLTLAEAAHRQGQERVAAQHLEDILKPSMNPSHHLARAWLAAVRARNYGDIVGPANHIEKVKKGVAAHTAGPRTETYQTWAEGELALALNNPKGAVEKADATLKELADFAPALELKARALRQLGRTKAALSAYEAAAGTHPPYTGIQWNLAEWYSEQGNDKALAMIDALEKGHVGTKGPDYEIFRGNHALRQGALKKAKTAFTQAADLGDSPEILFGLAKVAFEEEKKRGKKANLDRVAEAISDTLSKRRTFPEVYEYVANIDVWNYSLDSAQNNLSQAEAQRKTLKRPVPEMLSFYDRAQGLFRSVRHGPIRRQAQRMATQWAERKANYLSTLAPRNS